jgi:DNA-binding transcriptional ArsR family regulator
MHLTYPLDDVFASRSHVRILRALDELPDGISVSARELARRSGLSHPTASKVLESLGRQGMVVARRAPRADAFELNRRHKLVEKLRPFFEWEQQLFGEFMAFLGRQIERTPSISAAYLFGSVVRGEMTPGSDSIWRSLFSMQARSPRRSLRFIESLTRCVSASATD